MRNQGHILTDDIVVNYRNHDRDDSLHFLTHLDTSCKELSMIISPKAKRIYTSIFNSWFLKANFNVKHIDVQGFGTNKSYKITFKGNKYIYSFLDSKYTTGSVALLLHGPFGTYLYTGNFCYYPSFVRSPVLLPVIEEKALTRLYLDNTYYEQPSSFYGFDELANKVAELIRSEPDKNVYIYADKVSMDPLLAEIASKVKEKVYVCQSTMEIMKILGYSDFFTRSSDNSRIFIDKAFLKKRGYEQDNIVIYFNRYTESSKDFRKFEKRGNVYNFFFYCHSNHKEICELLTILKPESMTFLFSEIDKSKISYNLDFNNDIRRTTLFKSVSDSRPPNHLKGEGESHNKNQFYPKLVNKSQNACIDESTDFQCNEIVANSSFKKGDLNSSNLVADNKCPLRIRKVPEINNSGLINSVVNSSTSIQYASMSTFNNEGPCYEKIKDTGEGTEDKVTNNCMNEMRIPPSEKLHNYCKPKLPSNSSVKIVNISSLKNVGLSESSVMSHSETKVIHKHETVYKRAGLPFRIDHKFIKENNTASSNQFVKLSSFNLVPVSKKKTIVIQKKNIDSIKPNKGEMFSNYGHSNSKLNIMENRNSLIQKNHLITLEKTRNANSHPFNNVNQFVPLNQPHTNVLKRSHMLDNMSEDTTDRHNMPTSVISVESSLPSSNNTLKLINGSANDCNKDLNQTKTFPEANRGHKITNSFESMEENDVMDSESNENQTNGKISDDFADIIIVNSDDGSSAASSSKSEISLSNSSPSEQNSQKEEEILKPTEIEVIKGNVFDRSTKDDENNCMEDDNVKSCSKRTLSDVDDNCANSRKKLRSDSFSLCLLQPNTSSHVKEANLKECLVHLRKDEVEKTYFFSSYHNCHLPKFCGFKKHEVRPRHVLYCLRNLEKYIERSFT